MRPPSHALFRPRERQLNPTRSARTPLVMRPRRRRLKVPCGLSSALGTSTVPGVAPGGGDTALRSHRANPKPRAGRREALADPEPQSLARHDRSRGPHASSFREEERDAPRPRCLPSMSRPLSRGFGVAEAAPSHGPEGAEAPPENATGFCPQIGDNLWTVHDAFCGRLEASPLTERGAGDRAALFRAQQSCCPDAQQ